MIVGQRMIKNPITVTPETPVSDAQYMMRKEKVHRFPVVGKDGRVKGIVTEKDLLYATPSPATTLDVYEMNYLLSKLTVDEVMSTDVISVTEDTTVEEAARVLVDNNIGGLPVMRGGQLVGIITESDLFKVFLEMFASRQKGLRITLMVPEQKGELARLSGAVSAIGGNIVALGTFLGEDSSQTLLTMKVQGCTEEALREAVKPFVQRILDCRSV
ncbi:MAG: CBS domain-containing protein [Spirochaetales bacterium]